MTTPEKAQEIPPASTKTTITPTQTQTQTLQESEDSSYDSDCCELSSNNDTESNQNHYDVSRTVSDTLCQEFAEYVTTTDIKPRIEFAKKLGYTEEQLLKALSKLGPNPPQNELLSELISLDSTNTNKQEEEDESEEEEQKEIKRKIIIDGSNVAMLHGGNRGVFSCKGIQICVDWFRERGWTDLTVFVPSWRREVGESSDGGGAASAATSCDVTDPHILTQLEKENALVFTPSRTLTNKRRQICYDDRYILKLAIETDGIIVSNDNYRDLVIESEEFRKVVENSLLMFSFVGDIFMPPEDPLGRNGPSLTQFLTRTKHPTQHPLRPLHPCPYGRKCTYGPKCKYYHEKKHPKSITETLRSKAAASKTQSVPISFSFSSTNQLSRTRSAVLPSHVAAAGGVGGGGGQSQGQGQAATSEPKPHRKLQRQLSINPYENYLPPFPNNPELSSVWAPKPQPLEKEKRNSDVFFHLCAIFPEEQVVAAMEANPGVEDPSVICKEILRMFK